MFDKRKINEIDKGFNEALFVSYVSNLFVKLLNAVMYDELDEVDHFISDKVYEEYKNIIEEIKSKNEIKVYDELNVANVNILDFDELQNSYRINVQIVAKYMEYNLDANSKEFKSGNNLARDKHYYNLYLEKKKNTKEKAKVKVCPGCGVSVNINASGKCEYCGTIFNMEEYDYILEEIKKI